MDAQVGEERRSGGVEGNLDREASARGAPGGGGVGTVGDVAPQVDEDVGVVAVALGEGRRNRGVWLYIPAGFCGKSSAT